MKGLRKGVRKRDKVGVRKRRTEKGSERDGVRKRKR